MIFAFTWTWWLDGWIVGVGVLCAVASALLGNFLVLRKMSMLGDAVTHAVLPGIAIAFLVSHSRSSLPMFVGAVIVGILTAVFTEWIRRVGKVDEGASMGVVFTSLFAVGLVLVTQTADHVDLDPDCVLYGAIELTPLEMVEFTVADADEQVSQKAGKSRTIGTPADQGWVIEIPRAAITLGIVVIINLLFVVLFFKELKISSFDPALATTMGFSAKVMHYLLMVLVSVTAVASFESVGSILVVAMFVVPPAAAYMLTDRLGVMILLSVVIASISAVTGHLAAITVPGWFGLSSTTTAGMMAVMAGLLFTLAAFFGPKHGVIVKSVRRQLLSLRILSDDIVAFLYRCEERESSLPTRRVLSETLFAGGWTLSYAIRGLLRRGEIGVNDGAYALTDVGRDRARDLIRSHRLWEKYLVSEADAQTDRIHEKAERFEHFTDRNLRDELDRVTDASEIDPHGRPIPKEKSGE